MEKRVCKACGEEKNESDFAIAHPSNGRISKRYTCKVCMAKRGRDLYWGRAKTEIKITYINGKQHKLCYGCKKYLSLDNFGSKKNGFMGLDPRCVSCRYLQAYKKPRPDIFTKEKIISGKKHRLCTRCKQYTPLNLREHYYRRGGSNATPKGKGKYIPLQYCTPCSKQIRKEFKDTITYAKHTLVGHSRNITVKDISDDLAAAYLQVLQIKRFTKEN